MGMAYRGIGAFFAILCVLALGGCGVLESSGERQAKAGSAAIGAQLRPAGAKPPLPELKRGSPFEDYLRYALLNSPEVEGAYYDWASAVQSIAVSRSLPDPRLTFQMDIQNGFIPSVMPGIQFDFPGPGKLAAAAEISTAASDAKFHLLVGAVQRAAFDLEKSCWELQFLDARLASLKRSYDILAGMESQASVLNVTGSAKLQDVLRAQIERERLATEIRNLEDSRSPLLERFKASLGLKSVEAAPPPPESVPGFPPEIPMQERMLAEALKGNPALKALEAEIRQAEGSLSMARRAGVPDFSAGGELDARAAPVLFRPMASMTLPIWREKIAAGIAAAQAAKRSSESRLDAAQIALAVQCAEKAYLAREAAQNIESLQVRLIPKALLALDAAKLAYASGKADFLTVLDAERTLLAFDIELAAAQLQRNLSIAELALVIAGRTPPEAEFLNAKETSK